MRLNTDQRCWFQHLFASHIDHQYQCDNSADPTINAIAKRHKDDGHTVAVLSIDSDLHTIALANIDIFVWVPTNFYAPTFVYTTQQQLIKHYRHIFRVANANTDIARLVLQIRLLAGTTQSARTNTMQTKSLMHAYIVYVYIQAQTRRDARRQRAKQHSLSLTIRVCRLSFAVGNQTQ